MTKFIAYLGLTTASTAVAFGNYWFTFGLWPKSWVAFFGFWALSVVILTLHTLIAKED